MDDELWTINDISAELGWDYTRANQAVSRWLVNGQIHHAGTTETGYSQYRAHEVRAANTRDRLNAARFRRRAI